MADLSEYMESEHAVCAGDLIIPHLLWADDFVLFSETRAGLQRQLNGLLRFCRNNAMIVNHVKTKAMLFGKQHEFRVTYNGEAVEVVQSYRYLGNVVQHIQRQNGDIYSNTHEHLSKKGRKACFSLQHRLRQFNDISPSIMCNMYETLVLRPLKVKSPTSHVAVVGECGQLSPSVLCHINALSGSYLMNSKYFMKWASTTGLQK